MKNNRLEILGNNIRAERVRKKLTQPQLAELIGMNENSIAKIERAEQSPSALAVLDIANALDIPTNELFKGIPKNDAQNF